MAKNEYTAEEVIVMIFESAFTLVFMSYNLQYFSKRLLLLYIGIIVWVCSIRAQLPVLSIHETSMGLIQVHFLFYLKLTS